MKVKNYIGFEVRFKLQAIDRPQDKTLSGFFKAKYCKYKLQNLVTKSRKLLDLVRKEKQHKYVSYYFPRNDN